MCLKDIWRELFEQPLSGGGILDLRCSTAKSEEDVKLIDSHRDRSKRTAIRELIGITEGISSMARERRIKLLDIVILCLPWTTLRSKSCNLVQGPSP